MENPSKEKATKKNDDSATSATNPDLSKAVQTKSVEQGNTVPDKLRHAGVYASQIYKRLKEQNETCPVVPLPPHVIGGIRDVVVRTKQCNCRRSNCLKLYCECFAAGIHCSVLCHCIECKNDGASRKNDEMRSRSLTNIIDRNPNAFRPKLTAGLGGSEGGKSECDTQALKIDSRSQKDGINQGSRTRGCNCKKSSCLKKYCECFQATVYCSSSVCKCRQCKNIEGNELRESLIKKMIKNASEQTMQSSAQGGLIASSADMFLPPSTYAVPLHFEGAEAPAISFGTSGVSRVEMMVSKPIKVENLPTQLPETIKLEQLRDGNDNVLETDLQRKWRIIGTETTSLLDSIKNVIQGKTDNCYQSSPRKRAASEISSSVIKDVSDIIQGIYAIKNDTSVKEGVLPGSTTIHSSVTPPHNDASADKSNDSFECTESLESILPRRPRHSHKEEMLMSQQNLILMKLASKIKSTALKLADKRRKRNQNER